MIGEHIGDIDVPAAFKILHQDKRWFGQPAAMASYVFPGCGYGGYCLPKDTAALSSYCQRSTDLKLKILEQQFANQRRDKRTCANKIAAAVSKEKTIGILGLAFKSGSDDVRLSPSKFIIEKLLAKGFANILAYDPMANEVFEKEYHLPIQYAEIL